ncbi:MAG: hypothetical protein QOF66_6903 [Mycobacterium sp.]|nr:hypothetical protein [Mycobacterium sp.]
MCRTPHRRSTISPTRERRNLTDGRVKRDCRMHDVQLPAGLDISMRPHERLDAIDVARP